MLQSLPYNNSASSNLAYSPPSYPSPWGTGAGDWASAYQRARALVSQMNLLEKVNLTTGVGYVNYGFVWTGLKS